MTIWNGITEQGAVVPIQVDAQGRVVVSGGGGTPAEVYGTAKAAGFFSDDGTLGWGYNCTTSRSGTGVYLVTFITPLTSGDVSVIGNAAGLNPIIVNAYTRSTTSVEIRTFSASGSSTDSAVGFAVFDGAPTDVTPLILPNSTVNEVKALRTELDKLKKDKNP